jgi:hypothetical protein
VNPSYYEWATGSYDGHVRVFRHPSKKKKLNGYNRGNGGIVQQPVKVQRQKAQTSKNRILDKDYS